MTTPSSSFNVHQMSSDIYRTKDGNLVRTCSVADGSGMVNVSLWGDYCEAVQPGDVIELIRGHTQLFKNQLTVYLTKGGTLRKIDELCMIYNDYPNMSEPNPEWIKNHSEKQLQQITSRR